MDYQYHRERLANGLTFVRVGQPHLHNVALALYARSGSRYESPVEHGISHFLEHMLSRGTSRYPSAYALNVGFENLGGTLMGATAPDVTELLITLPPESLFPALETLLDMVSTPIFSDIDTERRIIAEEIREDLDEHDQNVDIDFLARARLWAGHPLAQSVIGSEQNVQRFSQRDLQHWFHTHFAPDQQVLCSAGAIGDDALTDWVAQHFGRLSAKRDNPPPRIPPAQHALPGDLRHVHKVGSQTQIRISFAAPGMEDPAYAALEMLLRLLDAGMSTPLHRRIFEERALAYQVGASMECYAETGAVHIDAACSHGNVAELVAEVLDIVAGFRDAPVAPDDLSRAKARAIWNLLDFQDAPSAMCAWYGEQEISGMSRHIEDVMHAMKEMTPPQLQAMAQRVFVKENLFVTTVGAQTDRQLARLQNHFAHFG